MNLPVDLTSSAQHTRDRGPAQPPSRSTRKEENVPTEIPYLDGLRGFASLLVYIHHHVLWAHGSAHSVIERSFGYRQRYHFITLPFVRIFFNGGHFGTACLFVLSGYVLSIKILRFHNVPVQTSSSTLARKIQLLDHVRSAIIRRWFRLYLPLFSTTFAQITIVHLWKLPVSSFEPKATYIREIGALISEFLDFSFIFNRTASPWLTYNDHLWSVPMEFQGSLVTLLLLLVVYGVSPYQRMAVYVVFITYFLVLVTDGWHCAFFIAGASIRDWETWSQMESHVLFTSKTTSRFVSNTLVILGLYLGGVPTCVTTKCFRMNPGWQYLSGLSRIVRCDPKWIYLFLGSTLFFSSLRHTWLKKAVESGVFRGLATMSYALYLTHGPVIQIFADFLYSLVGWPYGYRKIAHESFVSFQSARSLTSRDFANNG
ncbi:acyltransferase [Fusarium pseudoanthophilum]|uniref:Acyltransferase n=1 Tax=Fusarium pseudoanthophilum TaxID=48495 RepID=A0A8H5NX03_9HYPO|nr:acyltransferase [Fusarium pseudoanthophilum]